MLMKETVFRQYDIRGIVSHELRIDQIYRLTRAIIAYALQFRPIRIVALGMDGRISSPEIAYHMIRALHDVGCHVQLLGVCTSPVLYYWMHTHTVDMGLMITASHNPAEYNGIKIMIGTRALWGDEIAKIATIYHANDYVPMDNNSGTSEDIDGVSTYTEYLVKQFSTLSDTQIPMVIDCGNGAAGAVIPHLVKAFNFQNVTLLHAHVDGRFPHHEADPTVYENMQDVRHELGKGDYSAGIGFDGDADRLGVMTPEGYLIPGDQLLAIFAKHLLSEYPHATIIVDVKSSSALHELLERWGAHMVMSPCGHAIIKERMLQTGALLAGELSGHYCFADKNFGYDDGIYAFLRLLEILVQTQESLSSLIADYPRRCSTTEFRINCPEELKKIVMSHVATEITTLPEVNICTVDGLRITLPYGWGIIRPSNTQAVLSIRCESTDQEGLLKIKKLFYNLLCAYIECTELCAG